MNIWHKPDEKPIQRKWIVVKYRAPVKPPCKFVEKDTYISPVCDYAYLDDIITALEQKDVK